MNFNAAVAYIHSLDRLDTPQHTHNYAFEHGMARARHLLVRLGGAPNVTTNSVLVAGSKGKGSTVAMLSSVLAAAGYRVGAFTGPHLHTPPERFAIYVHDEKGFVGTTESRNVSPFHVPWSGTGITGLFRGVAPTMTEASFVEFVERIRAIVESWDRPELGLPTRFEAFVAMAYRWFEEQNVDIAVMEIGIGGRLDAVNLAEPVVSIITNISLEHTQMLGKTLPEIAYAKAGILRAGGVGVIARQRKEVERVIRAEAKQVGSRLQFAEECCRLHCVGAQIGVGLSESGQWVRVQYREHCAHLSDVGRESAPLFLPLLGRYQLENAAAVITAVQALRARGYAISHETLREGLTAVRWPGRFEVLRLDPIVIADGAHTPYSMQQLCASLQDYFPGRRIHFILGTLRDKDSHGIIQAAMPIATSLIFTGMDMRRATPPSQLYEIWRASTQSTGDPQSNQHHPQLAPQVCVTADFSAAMRQALERAETDDVICVAGSLHLVAEAELLLKFQGASVE